MKRLITGLSVIIVNLVFIIPPISPAQTIPSSWTTDDKIVAAYYFYWYDVYSGLHFVVPDGSDALTDHPPDAYLSNYSYKEIAWHRRELLDMMEAQIDIVLPIYWGSDVEAYWNIPGLQNLVSATQDLVDEGSTPPKIGMFFDTTALINRTEGYRVISPPEEARHSSTVC